MVGTFDSRSSGTAGDVDRGGQTAIFCQMESVQYSALRYVALRTAFLSVPFRSVSFVPLKGERASVIYLISPAVIGSITHSLGGAIDNLSQTRDDSNSIMYYFDHTDNTD